MLTFLYDMTLRPHHCACPWHQVSLFTLVQSKWNHPSLPFLWVVFKGRATIKCHHSPIKTQTVNQVKGLPGAVRCSQYISPRTRNVTMQQKQQSPVCVCVCSWERERERGCECFSWINNRGSQYYIQSSEPRCVGWWCFHMSGSVMSILPHGHFLDWVGLWLIFKLQFSKMCETNKPTDLFFLPVRGTLTIDKSLRWLVA